MCGDSKGAGSRGNGGTVLHFLRFRGIIKLINAPLPVSTYAGFAAAAGLPRNVIHFGRSAAVQPPCANRGVTRTQKIQENKGE